MNQQINLFLPEFRVQKDPLTAKLMAQILGGLAAVLLLVSAYDFFNQWQLGNRLEQLQASLVEETNKTDELDEVLARRSENTALTTRLEQAELRLESSRQIRDFLSQTALGNVDGFSEYFKDISRASMEGLSISEFTISEGGRSVQLTGQVFDSAMVPRYVSNIENGQSPLRRMRFSPSISKANVTDQFFSFQLVNGNGGTGDE
jgi:multidrug efflux pump subunit AcrA (membrane-fusion protein)